MNISKVIGKILLGFGIMFATAIILTIVFNPFYKESSYFTSQFGLIIASITMFVWFEKNNEWSLGFEMNKILRFLLFGGLVAAIIPTFSVISMLLNNSISLELQSWSLSALTFQCFLFLVIAFGEETFFRGYLYGMLNQSFNNTVAIITSALLFTTVHLMNPDAFAKPLEFIVIELLNIFLLGVLFAQVRFMTGSLWMPISLHFMINFIQSSVFGFLNGGKQVESLMEITFIKESIWNGAGFGVESSLMLTPILIISMILVKKALSKNPNKTVSPLSNPIESRGL
ncbi:CAAX prenyl protease-like protein [Ureibacillus xyleni]|uniref:CAAX prenyl protease-like protein n=1 Tax=Ureibacillus xyleni TaxID=614648 RepID=A0A285SM88_9BACL|nr:type II CAAX endopeptidase family protein [Ureibacillus xyleni]SOC08551.1 CAAX prenyl protease-like protein [Ureibacillus xyleni]